LNIVFVSAHACIRVQKMALPLTQVGHKVHLIAKKIPSFYECYDTFSIYSDAGQLINVIKRFEKVGDIDIYHCHNEPSWFVTILKERTGVPVVLDVHDTYLTRLTPAECRSLKNHGFNPFRVSNEERLNFRLADGLVFVSDSVRDVTMKEFELNQPSLVLPSYVPDFLYKYNMGRYLGGLVYEGKVTLPGEIDGKNERMWGFSYCDYTRVAKDCTNAGIDFHLYPGTNEAKKHYNGIATVHPGYPYLELLTCLTRHDWGLVGNMEKSYQWEMTLTNKMFEYLACGLPVVAINASESSKFIEKHDVGITVESMRELKARWGEHRKKQENVIKFRQKFIMDNHIDSLLELYKKLICLRGAA